MDPWCWPWPITIRTGKGDVRVEEAIWDSECVALVPASAYTSFVCLTGRRQGRWKQALDVVLLEALQAPPYGFEYEETVSHLLRAVRNTVEHITEWGVEAQDAAGHDKAAILGYFCGRFPRLLIGAWQWACGEKECREDASVGEWLEPAFGA